jgi:hypothetical protein
VDETNVDELMLTTSDNPYNPKTDYDNWKQWDEDNGYDTESYVARVLAMQGSFDIDDEFKINSLLDKAYQDILKNDVLGVYILI